MTATATTSTVPRSVVGPCLFVAALVLAAFAYFWFQPDAADEARLALLEADETLVLPSLDGEMPELIGTDTSVASRSWTGEWSITERADRYALQSPDVERYLDDLYDHMDDSAWDITNVNCNESQIVITGRQVVDGDWATLDFTAWTAGETGRLSVSSTITAVGGDAIVIDASEIITARIECPGLG